MDSRGPQAGADPLPREKHVAELQRWDPNNGSTLEPGRSHFLHLTPRVFPLASPALASRPRPPPKPGPSPMPHEVLPLVTLAVAVASFLYSKRIFTNSPLLSRSGLEVSLPA